MKVVLAAQDWSDIMKPRFEPYDAIEVNGLLKQAQRIEERLEKAQPGYRDAEGSTIGPSHFVTETGGNAPVRTAHYYTNGSTMQTEDVENKGATMEYANVMDGFKDTYPTNESTLASHVNGSDEQSPALAKQVKVTGETNSLDNITESINRLSHRL